MSYRQGGHAEVGAVALHHGGDHGALCRVVVGPEGVIALPKDELARLGVRAGSVLEIEATEDGLVVRPPRPSAAAAEPAPRVIRERARPSGDDVIWSAARKAAILINTACSGEDFAQASAEVRKLGVDPREIWSDRPEAA